MREKRRSELGRVRAHGGALPLLKHGEDLVDALGQAFAIGVHNHVRVVGRLIFPVTIGPARVIMTAFSFTWRHLTPHRGPVARLHVGAKRKIVDRMPAPPPNPTAIRIAFQRV